MPEFADLRAGVLNWLKRADPRAIRPTTWMMAAGVLLILVGLGRSFGLLGGSPLLASTATPEGKVLYSGFLPYEVPVQTNLKAPAALDQPHGTPASAVQPSEVPSIILNIPTQAPPPYASVPEKIYSAKANLSAPVVPAEVQIIEIDGVTYEQWKAPDTYAVGWHTNSALLGMKGNTVLNGHHNVSGEVFRYLNNLENGDQIFVYGGDYEFKYRVVKKMILPETDATIEERIQNARWILPSDDERLTLVTCWPQYSNTHRLIIIAEPDGFSPAP